MGLSRNKVAVSEGAAGSPPFYGEREDMEISSKKRLYRENRQRVKKLLFNFEGPRSQQSEYPNKWGCSSAGRAPALQAGGQGFDSLHLHQPEDGQRKSLGKGHGLIAQQVRARA